MNAVLQVAYEGAARVARALSSIAPSSENKLLRTFAARRGALSRYESFQRDHSRQLLWMHAPSVGEGLQARPVIDLVRTRRPDVQRAYTYFSPSARDFAKSVAVDFNDVLPFDATSDMRRALAALSPTALVFSKVDVWPTLAREASDRGTRLGLISATLARQSSRNTGIAGAILRDAYSRLDRVGAISPDDADRLVALGVPPSRVTVTGDTRYDQVWARARATSRESALLLPLASDRPTVVAGSTWPSDEAVLFDAWTKLLARNPDARLIIAPHEPTPAHLAPIERWGNHGKRRVARLNDPGAPDADIILVDRTGVLSELYALASVAYVGGGFHTAGLHSVLEPAAFGSPVIFGPRFSASRDARRLLDADAAISVADSAAMMRAFERWVGNPSEAQAAGAAARRVVHGGLGADERSFALVADLLR